LKATTKLGLGVAILAVLTPLGLLLPELFHAGSAWGEWGPEEIAQTKGSVPQGMDRLATVWDAPLPDYSFKGWEEKGLPRLSLAYIVCGLAGAAATVVIAWAVGRGLTRRQDQS
jgi:cobalt/nickel transport protein